MSTLLPLTIAIGFIAVILFGAEVVDRLRKRHKGDVPSSVLERREKKYPYNTPLLPLDVRVKAGPGYSGVPDFSSPIPELDDRDTGVI